MPMEADNDWQKIFVECKKVVQTRIKPCLVTIREPQPNLGMGAGGDVMKPVDLAAEKAIVETLKQNAVSFTLISEESGVKRFGAKSSECFVTVDPIDGTTNFMRGLPFYCCSIAVSRKPMLFDVYAGLVADLVHDVTYTAFEGKGAYRNGKKMETSKTTYLEEAVIGLDLNCSKSKIVLPKLSNLIAKTKHIRHFGANALELCYVANGLTDAFVDIREKLRATDAAAGFLILKEAGGLVTTIENKELDVVLDPKQTLSFIASGNKEIHKKIIISVNAAC